MGKEARPRKYAVEPVPADYDIWKMPALAPEQVRGPLLEESSFATLFPKYREKYIKEVLGVVQRELGTAGIKLELDLAEGSLTVRTTKKTWDPYSIVKARDVIKLLARSVPYQVALRLMQDEVYCEIIKIKNIAGSKEKFVKRRARLIGPNGGTLKCLELLTECYILVQGSTVCAVGHFRQLKQVRRIVEDVMRNVHPLYHIKELMIRRELEKDERLRGQSWDNFLPKFAKVRSVRRKIRREPPAPRNLFPEPPQPRKEDLQVESGEFFLSDTQRRQKKAQLREEREERARQERAAERQKSLVPPTAAEEAKARSRGAEKVGSGTDVNALLKRFNIPTAPA